MGQRRRHPRLHRRECLIREPDARDLRRHCVRRALPGGCPPPSYDLSRRLARVERRPLPLAAGRESLVRGTPDPAGPSSRRGGRHACASRRRVGGRLTLATLSRSLLCRNRDPRWPRESRPDLAIDPRDRGTGRAQWRSLRVQPKRWPRDAHQRARQRVAVSRRVRVRHPIADGQRQRTLAPKHSSLAPDHRLHAPAPRPRCARVFQASPRRDAGAGRRIQR
jgi:hypothetical protein